MKRVMADEAGMEAAVAALQREAVVAYPTETVYGLGVNPFSETALDALFAVKEREPDRPVLLVVDALSDVERHVVAISDAARTCMEAFWPGPLSLLLHAVPDTPGRLTDPNGYLCVRCSEHPVARTLCRAWGGPITSTSANLSGHPPARTAEDAALPGVALVLDAGPLTALPPSTVFNPETGQILRAGPITEAMLLEAGVAVRGASDQ